MHSENLRKIRVDIHRLVIKTQTLHSRFMYVRIHVENGHVGQFFSKISWLS